MAWAVSNARVEPKSNAITITKQAFGSAKIDPLMAAFNAPLALLKRAAPQIRPHSSKSRTPWAVIATLIGGSPAPTNQPLTSA
jgi:phage terminase large subunit-like protein